MQGVEGSGRVGAWDWLGLRETSLDKQLYTKVSVSVGLTTAVEVKLAGGASNRIESVSGGSKSLAGCIRMGPDGLTGKLCFLSIC